MVLIPGYFGDEVEGPVLVQQGALTLAREIVQVGRDFGTFLCPRRVDDDLDVGRERLVADSAMTPGWCSMSNIRERES